MSVINQRRRALLLPESKRPIVGFLGHSIIILHNYVLTTLSTGNHFTGCRLNIGQGGSTTKVNVTVLSVKIPNVTRRSWNANPRMNDTTVDTARTIFTIDSTDFWPAKSILPSIDSWINEVILGCVVIRKRGWVDYREEAHFVTFK